MRYLSLAGRGYSKVDTDMKFKMMYSFLNSDLDIIEKTLEEAVQADSALLREASLHLLQAGESEFVLFLFCLQQSSERTIFIR